MHLKFCSADLGHLEEMAKTQGYPLATMAKLRSMGVRVPDLNAREVDALRQKTITLWLCTSGSSLAARSWLRTFLSLTGDTADFPTR
jgi:hypothetical protein